MQHGVMIRPPKPSTGLNIPAWHWIARPCVQRPAVRVPPGLDWQRCLIGWGSITAPAGASNCHRRWPIDNLRRFATCKLPTLLVASDPLAIMYAARHAAFQTWKTLNESVRPAQSSSTFEKDKVRAGLSDIPHTALSSPCWRSQADAALCRG